MALSGAKCELHMLPGGLISLYISLEFMKGHEE